MTVKKIKIDLGKFLLDHSQKTLDLSTWGKNQIIVKGESNLYLVSAQCPHQGLPLKFATLNNNNLTCRWHGCMFSLTLEPNSKGRNLLQSSILEVKKGYVELPD